jgi:uncharacterized damage-inducible protein DinB
MMNSTPISKPVKNPVQEQTMKEMVAQYVAYGYWANRQLVELISSLPEDKPLQDVPSSFRSLYATILHMWDADSAWWQRIKMTERVIIPSENFKGDLQELARQFLMQNQQWIEFVNNTTDAGLDHVFQYYNSKKEYFKQPVWQVILHAHNHATFHRGQLVTMLRFLGIEKIPSTDFIAFTRLRRTA